MRGLECGGKGLIDGAQPLLVYLAEVEARLTVRRLRSNVKHQVQRGMVKPILKLLVDLSLDELLRGKRAPKN